MKTSQVTLVHNDMMDILLFVRLGNTFFYLLKLKATTKHKMQRGLKANPPPPKQI